MAAESQLLHWIRTAVDIAALFALVFAIKQWRDAREQTKYLLDIRQSLQTRFIGGIEDYVGKIVELIRGAKKTLAICTDVPAYYGFTDFALSRDYRSAVQAAVANGVTVRMICFDRDARRRFNEGDFLEELKHWDAKGEAFRQRLDRFLVGIGAGRTSDQLSPQEFLDLLERQDCDFTGGLLRGSVHEYPGHIPLYFWIADGTRAIFAVPSLAHASEEYGFATEDPRLIAELERMFERYKREIG